jgi:dipeptidyl aminopeptidase/acylaminoacyl peptidase
MTHMKIALAVIACLCCSLILNAEIKQFPGGKELPHEKYIHAVSEAASPVQQVYVKTKDGLYVAAAMRKPQGNGPFPVLIHFHGAPGGRGMEKLVTWSRGDTGSPVFERFLQDGYVTVVSDYRAAQLMPAPPQDPNAVTYADDAVSVLEYVKKLPYVDPERINVYGVSLGGDVVMNLISRTKVRAAILGAPAPIRFLGVQPNPNAPATDRFKGVSVDSEKVQQRLASVANPILILVGTADSLLPLDRILHDELAKAGKNVTMEIYENGYHDFVMGPQGHEGRKEPLMDITLDSLESTLKFLKGAGN